MSIAVRRAAAQDLAAVAPLFDAYRQFYGRPADLEGARRFLGERLDRGDSVVLLAFDGAEAVGFTQLYPSFSSASMAKIFVLNDLFVKPQGRRRGVGSALLQAAADFGRSEGAVRLTLSTGVANSTAQSLYEQTGWKRDADFFVYNLTL
jgi:GNAT superfamily N-acetyltransferase